MSKSKTLILYDFINHKVGGGELVLSEVLKLYPEADIMALVINKDTLQALDENKDRFFYKNIFYYLPSFIKQNPLFILPFIPREVSRWTRIGKKYDKVIAVSSAWCHNYVPSKHQEFYSYLFSPPRMIWDQQGGYLNIVSKRNTLNKFILRFSVSKFTINYFRYKLRLWDFYHNYNISNIASISKTTQKRISKYYHTNSDIIYPFLGVDQIIINEQDNDIQDKLGDLRFLKDKDFFLSISVLADYKNIDFIIKSFLASGIKDYLIIAGTGPMENKLKELAKNHENIIFLGYIDNIKKQWLLKHCQAFLFAAKEDFGIAPLEANYFGQPIIAGDKGSMKEIVSHKENGYLYKYKDINSLASTLNDFKSHNWDKNHISGTSKKYNIDSFRKDFLSFTNMNRKSL